MKCSFEAIKIKASYSNHSHGTMKTRFFLNKSFNFIAYRFAAISEWRIVEKFWPENTYRPNKHTSSHLRFCFSFIPNAICDKNLIVTPYFYIVIYMPIVCFLDVNILSSFFFPFFQISDKQNRINLLSNDSAYVLYRYRQFCCLFHFLEIHHTNNV